MHFRWHLLAVVLLTAGGFCADQPQATEPAKPAPTKRELKQAKSAFAKGIKLQNSRHLAEALEEFDNAVRLSPENRDYLTAREMLRQQLVFERTESGNASLRDGRQVEALADFRSALALDPQNAYAQQRLSDITGVPNMKPELPRILADSGELHVKPNALKSDFHYRGDPRELIKQIANVYGLSVVFDDSVVSRPVRFDITNVDFYTAMEAAGSVTKTFWTPLSEKEILIAADNIQNHRDFDRMVLRTFYVPGLNTPKDASDLANLLRSLFEIRFVMVQAQSGTLVIRAPQRTLDAATEFIDSLDHSKPQVMLDIRVYEISHTFMRDMGLHLPSQFQMFNVPVGALAALGGQNIQDLINQLISSGGINQANSTAISALLQQLQNQQNSLFSQPVVTFGNGLTLMAVSLGNLSAQLSTNESWVKTLEHANLRASQGDDATFKIGTRFPILNASFAPIFNNSAISQVVQNGSFQAPFPSFNYEDLGLNLKAKPVVSRNSDVTLTLEMQFRTLLGQSLNGIPVISNREYKGTTTLKEGESTVLVGSVSRTDSHSMSGIPGFGKVPALNKIVTTNSKQESDDELMIVVTPYVVEGPASQQATEIWLKQ
jgi:general secretion pathway protein D